jgi:[acyl-carrier-protein] S-malonyltransferase
MGRETADQVPAASELFELAGDILGYDLAQICANGPAEVLDTTAVSQPALFVCSLAALERLKNAAPDVVSACRATAGLSLGEYTALTFAGAIEYPDALRVVQARGQAMQAASDQCPSGMVSVLGLELAQVQDLCEACRNEGEVLQVANLLCPGNIVVSGSQSACQRVTKAAEQAGAVKVVPLAVAGAFHTPIMGPAVERLGDVLRTIEIRSPRIPVISNVDARAHSEPDDIRDLLIEQVVKPVRWEDSIRWMLNAGFDTFYEVGPGRVLRGLLRRIDRKATCESIE